MRGQFHPRAGQSGTVRADESADHENIGFLACLAACLAAPIVVVTMATPAHAQDEGVMATLMAEMTEMTRTRTLCPPQYRPDLSRLWKT